MVSSDFRQSTSTIRPAKSAGVSKSDCMVVLFLVPADVSLPAVKSKIWLEANSDFCKSCFAFLPFDRIPRSLLFLQRYKSEKYSALQLQLSSQFFEQQMSQTSNLLFYNIIKRALRSSHVSAGFESRA